MSAKSIKREEQRKERQRIYKLCKRITGQSHLESILLDVPNRVMRRAVYDEIKSGLKFVHHYPDWLDSFHADNRAPMTPASDVPPNPYITERQDTHVC